MSFGDWSEEIKKNGRKVSPGCGAFHALVGTAKAKVTLGLHKTWPTIFVEGHEIKLPQEVVKLMNEEPEEADDNLTWQTEILGHKLYLRREFNLMYAELLEPNKTLWQAVVFYNHGCDEEDDEEEYDQVKRSYNLERLFKHPVLKK